MSASPSAIVDLTLSNLADTEAAATVLANVVRPGDVIALHGDLGSGKTAFARAFINALPGDFEEVPSPTFTLVQTYLRETVEVWHFDLYRLEHPDEALELGIEDAFADGVSLIEWPERLGDYLPRGHLLVTLTVNNDAEHRQVALSDGHVWRERLEGCNWGILNV